MSIRRRVRSIAVGLQPADAVAVRMVEEHQEQEEER